MIEQIISSLPERWQPFYLRTSAGAEVDLLLVNPQSEIVVIEVKYSSSPKDSRGFVNLIRLLTVHQVQLFIPERRNILFRGTSLPRLLKIFWQTLAAEVNQKFLSFPCVARQGEVIPQKASERFNM